MSEAISSRLSSGSLSGRLQIRVLYATLMLLTLGGIGVAALQFLSELDHTKRTLLDDLRARSVALDQSLHVVQEATEALINEIDQRPGALDPATAGSLLRMAYNARGTSDIAQLLYVRDSHMACAQDGDGPCGGWLAEILQRDDDLAQGRLRWSAPFKDKDGLWIVAYVAPVSSERDAWVAAEIQLSSLQKYVFAVHSVESQVSIVDGGGHVVADGDSLLAVGAASPTANPRQWSGRVGRSGDNYLAAERITGPDWVMLVKLPVASLAREAAMACSPLALTVLVVLAMLWAAALAIEIRILRPARAAGAKLAETLSNLEVTFSSISNGIALLDDNRQLIACNERFHGLLGVRQTIVDFSKGLPADLSPVDPSGIEGEDGTRSFQFSNRHGRWVEVLLRPWKSDDRAGMVAVLTDITERREATERLTAAKQEAEEALATLQQAQTRLIEAEKLAALGELVAGVAHEINTPIGVAMSAATSLVDQTRSFVRDIEQGSIRRSMVDDFKATLTETAAMVERNIGRASDLIRQFKQVAVDRTSYQRRRFDLRQVVEETIGTLFPTLKRTNYSVKIDIPPDIGLDGYPGPLGQVITNLVTNAVIHAFEGRASGTITLSGHAENGQVTLICRDDGVGIPPAVAKRMFEPFFTTKRGQGGSGLGMHIVYSLVTGLMGGDVAVASEPGQGTEIRMTLPVRAPDQPTGDNHDQ